MSLPAHARAGDGNADPAALVGRVLDDRYRVTGLLGAGGIGRVYRAEHIVLGRPVAIKVLLEHYQCVPELQRRFEREAMALATLSHPNIVTITDFVSTRDVTFLVMELLEGEELGALLDRGPMAVGDAFSVMEQILSSLAYAHERDVIHRDLKPQNVLVRRLPGGRLHTVVLDFGLAKFMDGSGPNANLTKTGLIVGTPAYMAPEQASGSRSDQRADVYAAGLMFYEMLAGSHPFEGFEGPDLIRQHLLTPAPALAERVRGARVAPQLESFFARALAKDGADRFADGGTMLEALLSLPPSAFEPGDAVRKRRKGIEKPTAHADTRPAIPAAVSASRMTSQKRRRRALGLTIAGVTLAAGIAIAAGVLSASNDPDARRAQAGVDALELAAGADPSDDAVAQDEGDDGVSDDELAAEAQVELGDDELANANDPSLDEPADAPLEEDEAEAEPEPPPPAQRLAARNPWAGRDPASLALVRRRLSRGQTITKRHMRQIASYRRHHPSDVRATLLLAQAYASRGWLSAALDQYRRAYRRDPSSRGDPRMLRDLVRMSGTDTLHEQAVGALTEIYGSEAAGALGRAIARERSPADRARLSAALERVRGSG